MGEAIKAKPWVLVLVGVLSSGVLVALNMLGIITMDGAEVTGATGAIVLAIRLVLARVTSAGWGWKSITAGVGLLALAVCDAFVLPVPGIITNAVTWWAAYALGDAVGLMKPTPKTK